jgi:hypothetical protein
MNPFLARFELCMIMILCGEALIFISSADTHSTLGLGSEEGQESVKEVGKGVVRTYSKIYVLWYVTFYHTILWNWINSYYTHISYSSTGHEKFL